MPATAAPVRPRRRDEFDLDEPATFELVQGVSYSDELVTDEDGNQETDDAGNPLIESVCHEPGWRTESKRDLERLHQGKFRRVDPQSPVATETVIKPLEALSRDELISFAKREGIDLGDATRKAEIFNVVKQALDAR